MAFVSHLPKLSYNHKRSIPTHTSVRPCMTTDSLPHTSRVVTPSQWDLELSSPSKINLFLRIVRRRPDGFHDLASLFQSISLHDKLYFSVKNDDTLNKNSSEDTLECDTPGVPIDSSNLVLQALSKFRERTGVKRYFHVRLEKSIPHEAGLGGGSSNAATALWAANQLCGRCCDTQQLVEYGAEFGSDISFFLSNGTAYCTGRGEILQDVALSQNSNDLPVFIVKPPEGLSTGLVFKTLNIEKCSKQDPLKLLKDMQNNIMSANFVNDLETPSFQLLPRLAEIKQKLYDVGFSVVMMSGSGTSFFCLGQPTNVDHFKSTFASDNDVRIFEAKFLSRKSSDVWYFE